MEKRVSVIIPFYSGVDWLCEAVQSVLDQTYQNIEVIVVNDGSPEDIRPFLDKYSQKVVYRYQENQGPAVARNLAMSLATGEYIAFEDSDDIWLPMKLEKQISFMEENGFVWSHTGFYYWWPSSGKSKRINNHYDYGDISKQMMISFKMVTPSVVVHRKTMLEHPELVFPVHMRKAQDSAYFIGLAQYYKVALIEEPLVKIRMRGDNSNHQVLMRFEKRAESYEKYKKDPSDKAFFLGLIYWIYAQYHKLFGTKRNAFKEMIAKCMWAFPFILERIYLHLLICRSTKDNAYIKEWKEV